MDMSLQSDNRIHPASFLVRNFAIASLFFLVFSILEFAFHYFFFTSKISSDAGDLIRAVIRQSPGPLTIFLAQFLLCILILGAVTEALRAALRLSSLLSVLLYLTTVSIVVNLSQIPQVFTDQVSLILLQASGLIKVPVVLSLPTWALVRAARLRKTRDSVAAIAIALVIGVFAIFNDRGPTFLDRYDASAISGLAKDSILVLSVDSLRPDFVKDYVQRSPNSELGRLIQSGVQFERIVTSTAKTHSSLTALMTGERPEENGMRDNLFPGFRDTDKIYGRVGLVPALEKLGYKRSLIIDETKFADFKSGASFDQVIAPPYGYMNLLVTEVFQSTLYWSFFANSFGDRLIPSAAMNYAYSHGYRPKNFLKSVYSVLGLSKGEPTFLLAHTCAMHYPGHSRSPYLERYQTNPDALVTRYPQFFSLSSMLEEPQLEQFRHLTRGQFDLVMDEVVEPLLRELRTRGALQRIHFVLMSDHGETFWKPGLRYSRLRLPYHGQPALLDEDSQTMYALIHSPLLGAGSISGVQSVQDLTRILLSLLEGKKRTPAETQGVSLPMRYSESGVSGWGIFNSALNLSRRLTIDGYEVFESGGLGIKASHTDRLILQKTRSIFLDDGHWSFFPTDFGYETLVCRPPVCWSPRADDLKKLGSVVEFLNFSTAIDQQKGIGLKFESQVSAASDVRVTVSDVAKLKPEAAWFYATHLLNDEARVGDAARIWLTILKDETAVDEVRFRSLQSLSRMCELVSSIPPCREFDAWSEATESFYQTLRSWGAADSQWLRFIRTRPKFAAIVSDLPASINSPSTLQVEFLKIHENAVRTGDSSELRKFATENKNHTLMADNFYRRFWSMTAAVKPTSEAAVLSEIDKVRKHFEVELDMRVREVDLNWLLFLFRYSMFENVDVVTPTALSFLKEGRTPFDGTLNRVVPTLLNISDQTCFRTKIASKIFESEPAPRTRSSASWQYRFYERAKKLKDLCR